MNTLSNCPGVKNCRKVDHFRFLMPLNIGPVNTRTNVAQSTAKRAELLMRAITWCRSHRIHGNKNVAGLKSDLAKKAVTPATIERAMSIARMGTVRLCGHALVIQLYYSQADQDAFFDVRSWRHGTVLDDGIHAVKLIATDLGLNGIYTSHFCTVPVEMPAERRTLNGHFGGGVLVTATRHEFLTTHRLLDKLIADERARRVDLDAICKGRIGSDLVSPNDVKAGKY